MASDDDTARSLAGPESLASAPCYLDAMRRESRSVLHGRWVFGGVLGALLGLLACAPPEPAMEPILRFIEEPAPPVFDLAELLGEQVVRSWSFSGSPPGRWRVREIESARGDGVGWWFVPEQRRAILERDGVALPAAEIDVIAVEVEGRSLGGANLHWGPAGEPIAAERQLHVPFSGETRQTFLFRVGRHPAWRGEIGRLQLTLWTAPGTEVGVTSMKALKQDLDERRLEEAIGVPWRVDLSTPGAADPTRADWRERRLALLAWPGHVIERELDVPSGAELRLAIGVWSEPAAGERSGRGASVVGASLPSGDAPLTPTLSPRPPGGEGAGEGLGGLAASDRALRFRVLAVAEGGGEKGTVDGAVHVLADEPWPFGVDGGDDGRTGEDGWRELRLDLSQWAGSSLRLRLLVEGPEMLDPRQGVPFWAHPEVLAPSLGEPPPSVVLVIADTLRADRLSLYGHERPSSPNLDAWAGEHGAVFESVTASAGWTLPSHTSIFTGLDAPGHGVNWPSSRVGDSLVTLAELLYAGGYATEAITGGGYLDATYGLDRGFARYRAARRGHSRHEAEPPRTLDAALEALSRLGDRPFFLFVHTYAVHAPYAPWQPYFSRVSDRDPLMRLVFKPPAPGDFRARHELFVDGVPVDAETSPKETTRALVEAQYDAGVHRLDGLLAPLLEKLAGEENVLVIFTSDHGEMLGEGGHWDHGHVFDPTLKVPLVVQAPGGLGAGRRIERPARSVDLLPTILELLGAGPSDRALDGRQLDGRSLAPLLRGEPAESPAVAWSYGRRVDEGLTLRLRDRWKLLLHDDLLFDGESRVQAFELAATPRRERRIELPQELEALVPAARRKLLDELPGLHLRFSNVRSSKKQASNVRLSNAVASHGLAPLRFELLSGAAVPERVKVPDLPCDCVTWRPPVGLDVEVPPGETFTVVLTDVRDARLEMILVRGDGSRQRLRLDLTEHHRPLAMAVEQASFEVSAGAPPDRGVGVRWNGPRPLELAPPDSETIESLRALGYIR